MATSPQVRLTALLQRLKAHSRRIRDAKAEEILENKDTAGSFTIQLDELYFDWSLQLLDRDAIDLLVEYGEESQILNQVKKQFSGLEVNFTERRAALHSVLRGTSSHDKSSDQKQLEDLQRCRNFALSVLNGEYRSHSNSTFTDVVHVGIGGSYLGPKLLCDALPKTHLNIHFLTNASSTRWQETIQFLNPATTLFVIASKSFSTSETIRNYEKVRAWLAENTGSEEALRRNVVKVTAAESQLHQEVEYTFQMSSAVGGRFSLWSAMGLPVMLGAGVSQFSELLEGARIADQHVVSEPIEQNISALLALLDLWNVNCLGAQSHVILSYIEELRLLTGHLQQLEMESLGKSVNQTNGAVTENTQTVIWGGEETEGQHAWHQWLHQGTHRYSADVIATLSSKDEHDRWVLANGLAQQDLMYSGHKTSDPHKSIQGGIPSSLWLLKSPSARAIGTLIALFEHKVAMLGYLWNVNPFDQWGVEQGKKAAEDVDSLLQSQQDIFAEADGPNWKRLRKIAEIYTQSNS